MGELGVSGAIGCGRVVVAGFPEDYRFGKLSMKRPDDFTRPIPTKSFGSNDMEAQP